MKPCPRIPKAFDVGLIPFPISPVTLNANPLKAREYLAAGVPVVSTAIPEVEVLGQCAIGHTHDEFIDKIRSVLNDHPSRPQRSLSMASESWAARLEQIRVRFAAINGSQG